MLYEMLTGRPPFRAETAAETVRQVIHDEPVPPVALEHEGAARPRDDLPEVPVQGAATSLRQRRGAGRRPETVRRGSADPGPARGLGRAFLALVPAQPDGGGAAGHGAGPGRAGERRRGVARAAAGPARRELRNEVVTTVAQAVSLRQGFHFHEARELLEQVRQRLEPAGPDDLRRQVDQARPT